MKMCIDCGEKNINSRKDCWNCGGPLRDLSEEEMQSVSLHQNIEQKNQDLILDEKINKIYGASDNYQRNNNDLGFAKVVAWSVLVIGIIIGVINFVKANKTHVVHKTLLNVTMNYQRPASNKAALMQTGLIFIVGSILIFTFLMVLINIAENKN